MNYPIKACLVEMLESGSINLDCPHEKFCVSWFTVRVAAVGTKLVVESWNEHSVPGLCTLIMLITKIHLQ